MKDGARNQTRTAVFFLVVSVAVLAAAALSVVFGTAKIPFSDLRDALTRFDPQNANHQIIFEMRIPRTIGDIAVGAALAATGAIMQGMTRNPLADSGILGINAGAAFALSLCFALGSAMNASIVVVFSLFGAAFSTAIVYGLTGFRHGKQSPMRLALAGTAVAAFLTALSQAIAMYFNVGQEITFWTAGGVAGIRMAQLARVLPFVVAALAAAIALAPSLSILSLGDENAAALGLRLGRTKFFCMLTALVLAGAAVALAGPISFVGLIIPHIVRNFVGIDYRSVLPCSMLLGSCSMLIADLLSRVINPPHETPIGMIFALIGVPVFLYIARKGRREIGA